MVYLTVLAGLELVLIGGLVFMLLKEREAMAKLLAGFNLSAERERDRLVSRIQRPDLVPTPMGVTRTPKPTKDASSLAAIGGFAAQPKSRE